MSLKFSTRRRDGVPPGRLLLVLAGQVLNRLDGSFVESLEFEQALANVNAHVALEGGPLPIRVTCFLVQRPTDGPRIAAVIKSAFPHRLPTMSWIYVAGLLPDAKVETEAIAAVV